MERARQNVGALREDGLQLHSRWLAYAEALQLVRAHILTVALPNLDVIKNVAAAILSRYILLSWDD